MVKIIPTPTEVEAVGQPPKRIREYVGAVNTGDRAVSIAHMTSPAGWSEPGQTPQFDEYTLVLSGTLRVETRDGVHEVRAGQALVAPRGEWVRYSTPHAGGAEYVAVCLPAFTPETVHRDTAHGETVPRDAE
jgi:mannose-6-phosphate isomerase-like protein (cupin superfamily)